MLNKRLVVILAAVVLLVATAFFIEMSTATSGAIPSGAEASDYFQRQPNAVIPVTEEEALNYFQRHPDSISR